MKREIKFRAWDISKKSYHYPKLWDNTMPSNWQDHYILQQFTGLQDADGNDIYEGDIIQWHYHPTEDEPQIATQKVVWGEGGFFVLDLDSLGSDCLFEVMHREIRVIGNKFENSNLLQP